MIILATVMGLLFVIRLITSEKKHDPLPIDYDFCSRLPPVRISGRDPAAVSYHKMLWKEARVLKVFFRGNTDIGFLNAVISVANKWANFCDMSFVQWPTLSGSDIRVSFKLGGYSSAVGIEAEEPKYKNIITMYLQGLDTLRDSLKFRRTILHEFGHALGLEHELQNPSATIPWDTVALYKFYLLEYDWQSDSVDKYILKHLEESENSDFDSASIMIYAVPKFLTGGKFSVSWPNDLSPSDTTYIRKWYKEKHKKL
jgi:hypothetical protein